MLEATSGRIVLLANRVSNSSAASPGSPIMYANDLDIAADGTIYFTDSIDVYPHRNAQHVNSVSQIVSILGRPGYYDTVKGWALGMLQARCSRDGDRGGLHTFSTCVALRALQYCAVPHASRWHLIHPLLAFSHCLVLTLDVVALDVTMSSHSPPHASRPPPPHTHTVGIPHPPSHHPTPTTHTHTLTPSCPTPALFTSTSNPPLLHLGCVQGLPRGRLLAYYPGNGTTHVISEGYYYPNGVALSADGTWVAMAETDRLRVLK